MFIPGRPSISPGEKPLRSSMICTASGSGTIGGDEDGAWASTAVPSRAHAAAASARMPIRSAIGAPSVLCSETVPSRVFALSIHADYQRRHAGECCPAGWDVPFELPFYRALTDAMDRGQLATSAAAGNVAPFIVDPALPEDAAAIFERTSSSQCVFFEPGPNLCIVHRALGVDALPPTCRHFPRIAIRDSRGTFITLSHF